jgi:hypothetical protein
VDNCGLSNARSGRSKPIFRNILFFDAASPNSIWCIDRQDLQPMPLDVLDRDRLPYLYHFEAAEPDPAAQPSMFI